MMKSVSPSPRPPFAVDRRSLLLAVRALVGLLYERLVATEGPLFCTQDGTLGGLHLDAIVAGLQSHGLEADATLAALGSHDSEDDLVQEITDTVRMLLAVAPPRSPERGAPGRACLE